MMWLVGSSIIKNALQHVCRRPMGRNLSLQRSGYSVTWVGPGGKVLAQVLGMTQALLNWQDPPNFSMLHVGG